jgi:hypothetical protein
MDERVEGSFCLRNLAPALSLLVLSVLGIAALAIQPTRDQHELAVLAPPWDDLMRTAALVSMAGGKLVDRGGLPNVVVAFSASPGFATALYRAGAWLVMNPIVSHGCSANGSSDFRAP